MGTRLPSTSAASSELGPNAEVMQYLQQKRAWQKDRGAQGNLTADVLRYSESGGAAYYLVEPTYTQTSGLTALPCYVDDEPEEYKRRFGSMVEDATYTFVFYDVTGGITEHDVILHGGVEYAVLSVWHDEASGRIEVLTKELQET